MKGKKYYVCVMGRFIVREWVDIILYFFLRVFIFVFLLILEEIKVIFLNVEFKYSCFVGLVFLIWLCVFCLVMGYF